MLFFLQRYRTGNITPTTRQGALACACRPPRPTARVAQGGRASPRRRAALAANPPRALGNRTHPHILEPLGAKEPLAAQVVHRRGPVLVPVVVGHVFAAVGAPLKHQKACTDEAVARIQELFVEGNWGSYRSVFSWGGYRYFFFFKYCHLLCLCMSRFRFMSLERCHWYRARALSPPTRSAHPLTHARPAKNNAGKALRDHNGARLVVV